MAQAQENRHDPCGQENDSPHLGGNAVAHATEYGFQLVKGDQEENQPNDKKENTQREVSSHDFNHRFL